MLSAVLDTAAWVGIVAAVVAVLAAGVGEFVRAGQAMRLFREIGDVAADALEEPQALRSMALLHEHAAGMLAAHRAAERRAYRRVGVVVAAAVVLAAAARWSG